VSAISERRIRFGRSCVLSRLLAVSATPRTLGRALQGHHQLCKFRVGDYRLIAQIEDQALVVLVVKIGHRREDPIATLDADLKQSDRHMVLE
jgi:mRNA interferase RelE/StbE